MRLKIVFLLLSMVVIVAFFPYYENFDIPIYDEAKTVYNIGDKLNMPAYWFSKSKPMPISEFWYNENDPIYRDELNGIHKETVLYYYYKNADGNTLVPDMSRCRYAVDEYIKNKNTFPDLIATVSNPKTLTVHLRSGDKGVVEEEYIELIKKISIDYDTIFVLSGIHSETRNETGIEDAKKNLNVSLEKIDVDGKNIIINLDKADIHLSLMRKSSNLLLHKGGFSILGGILFRGNNLYVSNSFDIKENEDYMKGLSNKSNIIIV